ncbi:hypothetical protein A3C26_01600 [Candidatus Daviesbacteria bacterium RIFCSPHIGHO2_02_FULL_39_12]|uniref:tRNA/rRNA methyltransferase SpoU type domain-containing protein n=2 Tax=Candidatus Daviesiibacteriota TaxID=1752718 RepID=A0A1F5JCN9_9BACT|nr:MAG: hypothetical protein A3C26_01600 [Candidatus Daviesbacteria bacterium RIFCSPHIGHO2_02_FULL_39_12]OGE72872.1 MAG: hypothetical protein A3H40_01840 [Candidatus Daviesbacteria bacterium RIFCSPLOWO2_02_FULL_38_15]
MVKLNAKQLRRQTANSKQLTARNEIYIVLDNVLDTYNVGSIFRLADAVAAKKVYLCGKTEIPPNPRIKKASINTTEWVEWSYKETAIEAINDIRLTINDIQTVAVEQSKKSVPYDKFEYKLPVCLVVGNETYGVSKEVLDICDGIVEIPMYGINISLNVMVSLGIVLYQALGNTNSV